MSNLKRPFRSNLPPRGSPARLPALLVPVLAVTAVAQLLLPRDVALPPAGAVGRRLHPALPADAGGVGIPAVLAGRALFSPRLSVDATQAPTDPLGGAVFAGTVQQGGRRLAVVQLPQGRLTYLAPGGVIAGWRLAQLLPAGVRLVRGAEVITVNFGQRLASGTSASQSSAKDEPQ